MLSFILEKLKQLSSQPSEQQQLDDFIIKHCPTSVGDVEHWINEYDRRQCSNHLNNFGYRNK